MEAEVPLLKENRSEAQWTVTFAGELSRVSHIALPMIVVTASQYILRVTPLFMLGHVSELSLSSASIATSLCTVTGFSLLFGKASALETLCGQSYGAKQYHEVGTYLCGAVLCLFLVCIPVSVLWFFTEKLLVMIGQDPFISAEAGKYTIWLIPALFPYAVLQSLVRYLQVQSLIVPMVWSSLASLCFQLALCWAFVFRSNLGITGAALSVGISYWFNVVLLVLYVKYSPTCEKTFSSLSIREILFTVRNFLRFAVPSAVMTCLEWWAFELVILLSGVLPNPQLETSVLSICFTVAALLYQIPASFGAAASTLVSNELGAGKPQAARFSVVAVLALSLTEAFTVSITIFFCRRVLGHAFSNTDEVIDYVEKMAPFLCLNVIMDGVQSVLSGVARGGGWQHLGAYVNLGAFYLVGIPLALVLGFMLPLRGQGLWCGMVAGTTTQSLLLCFISSLTDWEKASHEAMRRIFSGEVVLT